jgi:hypothetical protein
MRDLWLTCTNCRKTGSDPVYGIYAKTGSVPVYAVYAKTGSVPVYAAMAEFAAVVVDKEKYKPAVCHGEPCEMIFPYNMKFIKR